jgi:hypothetical protein
VAGRRASGRWAVECGIAGWGLGDSLIGTHQFSEFVVPRSFRLITGARPFARLQFCLLASISLCLSGCTGGLEDTKQNGNQIIHALNEYHVDHGQYPKSLAELCPKYLRELPRATWGLRAWEYESDGKEFVLGVDESVRTGDGDSLWLKYRPRGKEPGWEVGD